MIDGESETGQSSCAASRLYKVRWAYTRGMSELLKPANQMTCGAVMKMDFATHAPPRSGDHKLAGRDLLQRSPLQNEVAAKIAAEPSSKLR